MKRNSASSLFRRPRAASDSGEQFKVTGGSTTLDKTRYRIVVMGAAEVGKTCVVSRMLDERFMLEYKATVEDMHSGQFEVNGHVVTLDILDTSGAYEFPAMRRLSIATSDAFILVYDVSDPASFQEVERFHRQIVDEKDSEGSPVVVVGNKTDLLPGDRDGPGPGGERRALERATAETIASIDWGCGYVEVSAKEDRNITGIFRELLAQVNLQMLTTEETGGGGGGGEGGKEGGKTRHSSLKGRHSQHRHHRKEGGLGVKRSSCRVS